MTDSKTGREVETDLLGDPVDMRFDNIGRPSHKKTKEKQRLVAALRVSKWSNKRIADYIGCDPDTLTKHYSVELQSAADLIEGAAIEAMLSNLSKGFQGAAGKLMDLARDGRAMPPATPKDLAKQEAEAEAAADAEAAGPVMGKKEAQAEAAKRPSKAWGSVLRVPGESGPH